MAAQRRSVWPNSVLSCSSANPCSSADQISRAWLDPANHLAPVCCRVGSLEEVPVHSMVGLGVANDRLDRRTAAQVGFDHLGDAALLARDVDLHLVVSLVAAIATFDADAV